LSLVFFSGVGAGLLTSVEDGEGGGVTFFDDGGGVFFFVLGMGWEGTGRSSFFGTGFADAGIGAHFFGTICGEDGADLKAAGVGG